MLKARIDFVVKSKRTCINIARSILSENIRLIYFVFEASEVMTKAALCDTSEREK